MSRWHAVSEHPNAAVPVVFEAFGSRSAEILSELFSDDIALHLPVGYPPPRAHTWWPATQPGD
jgi:hypothetical protein